jgi:hypothetical protein
MTKVNPQGLEPSTSMTTFGFVTTLPIFEKVMSSSLAFYTKRREGERN